MPVTFVAQSVHFPGDARQYSLHDRKLSVPAHYRCSKTRNLYKSSEYYLDGVANAARCSGQFRPVEAVLLSRFAIRTQVARPLRLAFQALGALFYAQSMLRYRKRLRSLGGLGRLRREGLSIQAYAFTH
jgi:hypothetical protein